MSYEIPAFAGMTGWSTAEKWRWRRVARPTVWLDRFDQRVVRDPGVRRDDGVVDRGEVEVAEDGSTNGVLDRLDQRVVRDPGVRRDDGVVDRGK
ncbi:MAG: hypothetical protein IPL41_11630 [Micropruina sp.]|nr:hypothetical protein [Micropruina sp.]